MSNSKNRESDSWEAVLASLRRSETTWRGIPLSPRDHQTWTEAVLLATMVLRDLSNQYPACGSTREHIQWCHTLAQTDVDQVAHFLPAVIDFLRHYHVAGSITVDGFKHHLREKFPFVGSLIAPVRGALELFFEDPKPDTLYAPYQLFSFLTHLSLQDLDMGSELEDEFLETERRVSRHRTPEFLVSQLREIMTDWFRDFVLDESNFHPHHGPGSVAELTGDRSYVSKYRLLKPTREQKAVFYRCAHVDFSTYFPRISAGVTTDCSEVVFVPKSMKTKRVISKEPATYMYLQKGVQEAVYEFLAKHRELRSRIDLRDQDRQRGYVLPASSLRHLATVDLSAASDSVGWDLVQRVFRDTPLMPFLGPLRTQFVKLPSGRTIRATKFAPMGSALCFPIESLIFAAIVECTVRYVHATTGDRCQTWGVYGDDIIVEEPCLEDLMTNLRFCGFRVNEGKSFGGNYRFREACGCEAYDGADVSPMKIGRRFTARKIHVRSASLLDAHISMANDAHRYGFQTLRAYLVRKVLDSHRVPPLFSQDGKRGFYSPQPTNHRAQIRWNVGLQRLEIRVLELSTYQSSTGPIKWDSKKKKFVDVSSDPQDEEIRLYEWFRLASLRSHLDPLSDEFPVAAKIGSAGTSLSKRWTVMP